MSNMRTKQGFRMNRNLRFKIIQLVVKHPELSIVETAARLGIGRRTLSDYLTEEVNEEIARLRAEQENPSLENVDKAMMAQACAGNVAAARLVYMRLAQRGEMGQLPSLEDMEADLERLKMMERTHIKERGDGETAGDAAAVGADAAG
jgi:hypothetical protein